MNAIYYTNFLLFIHSLIHSFTHLFIVFIVFEELQSPRHFILIQVIYKSKIL